MTANMRVLADKNFALLETNPRHPSLRLKPVGKFWSVRVGQNFRAIATRRGETFVWFWIGTHDEYERLIK